MLWGLYSSMAGNQWLSPVSGRQEVSSSDYVQPIIQRYQLAASVINHSGGFLGTLWLLFHLGTLWGRFEYEPSNQWNHVPLMIDSFYVSYVIGHNHLKK